MWPRGFNYIRGADAFLPCIVVCGVSSDQLAKLADLASQLGVDLGHLHVALMSQVRLRRSRGGNDLVLAVRHAIHRGQRQVLEVARICQVHLLRLRFAILRDGAGAQGRACRATVVGESGAGGRGSRDLRLDVEGGAQGLLGELGAVLPLAGVALSSATSASLSFFSRR